MADDLGYGDTGCYGQEKIKTPNIDILASEGMRFTQAYAGGPVCAPSRSVLMTGLDIGHTAVRDNIPHYATYLFENDITIAKVLKQAGYRCGGIGKWSLGDAGTVGQAVNQGLDMWFGYLNQDHAHYYYTEYLDDSYRKENNFRFELPGNTYSKEFYSHDLMAERALQFIRDSYKEPFFLYAAFTLPHFSATSEDEDGLAVPAVNPQYAGMDWPLKAKKYASMIDLLDRDIGRIINLIDALGLKENTLIIFTSDNGGTKAVWENFHTNGKLRGYKSELTEGGIRVPFIARWPGTIPAGSLNSEIIGFQDIMPTFSELADAQPPHADGISIVNTLLGKPLNVGHEYLYWDYGHSRNRYDQAVRYGNWKGIRLGQGNKIQLYNLKDDIGEKNDIADKYPEIVQKIEHIMSVAAVPSERYPIGVKYQGKPLWQPQLPQLKPQKAPPLKNINNEE